MPTVSSNGINHAIDRDMRVSKQVSEYFSRMNARRKPLNRKRVARDAALKRWADYRAAQVPKSTTDCPVSSNTQQAV